MTQDVSSPKLHLRPGLAIVPMPMAVQLRAGDEEVLVIESDHPEVAVGVLRALSVGQDRDSLLRTAAPEHAALILALLEELAANRLLCTHPVDERDEIGRYVGHDADLGSPRGPTRPRGPVGVIGETLTADLIVGLLAQHGIDACRSATGPPPGDVLVCVWEQPDLSTVLRVNAMACREGKACLFLDLSHGRHATLGPFCVPGETACYECFRERWRQNTLACEEFEAAEREMLQTQTPLAAYGILPAFRYQMAGMACTEMFTFLQRHRAARTLNRIVTVDLQGLAAWTESVWRVPWCPACGAGR